MIKSETIGKLAEALAKAQGEMKNAVKDAANPFFKSKYADLASISDACRPHLAANGLSVVQLPVTYLDGKLELEYLLMHSSGEYIGGNLAMNPVKNDPQGIGSAITYARRYTLAALAGVATEDDDGNAASDKAEAPPEKKAISFKKESRFIEEPKHVRHYADGTQELKSVAGIPGDHFPNRAESAINKKESVAPNGGQAAQVELVQNGDSAAPATELEKQLVASLEGIQQYITGEQSQEFYASCKMSIKVSHSKEKAAALIGNWLFDNGYINSEGRPSAKMIPAAEFQQAKARSSIWLKVQ